jgi:hypothetical protein
MMAASGEHFTVVIRRPDRTHQYSAPIHQRWLYGSLDLAECGFKQ